MYNFLLKKSREEHPMLTTITAVISVVGLVLSITALVMALRQSKRKIKSKNRRCALCIDHRGVPL
jgi:hypothetical protein